MINPVWIPTHIQEQSWLKFKCKIEFFFCKDSIWFDYLSYNQVPYKRVLLEKLGYNTYWKIFWNILILFNFILVNI